MATKNDAKTTPEPGAELGAAAAPQETPPPRLGELVQVRVADGLCLVNNETGQDFEPGQATPQTVTVTTLRRLADGDLVRI